MTDRSGEPASDDERPPSTVSTDTQSAEDAPNAEDAPSTEDAPITALPKEPADIARDLLARIRRAEPTDPHEVALAELDHDALEPIRTDRRAGLAFWLNVYNASAQLLLERSPSLFESRWRFFRRTAITVADVELSLDDVEHGILRGGRSKYGLGYLPRLARTGLPDGYELEIDPRIHFALNCGAASCPAIFEYDRDTVDDALDEAARSHLAATVEYDATRDRVFLPRVCLWFIGDFGGRSGLRSFLGRYDQIPTDSSPSLRFRSYDWTVAARKFAAERRPTQVNPHAELQDEDRSDTQSESNADALTESGARTHTESRAETCTEE